MSSVLGHHAIETLYESRQSLIVRAKHADDGRPVVLKILNEDYPSRARLERFSREFQMVRRAHGPGVIEALALERHGSSSLIVFEDFEGETLIPNDHRAVATGELLVIALRMAEIIDRVHALGITHKDVNPTNILRNPRTGEIKLIDFGISTELSMERPDAAPPSAIEGTLRYISPEQTGRLNRGSDRRTDLYSLGATLHHLATGSPPFSAGDALGLIHAHIAKPPVAPHEVNPEISPAVSAIILKLLAKSPDDRYQTAAGLAADLRRCIGSGAGAPFELGREDARGLLSIPHKLYGREGELAALRGAFQRAAEGSASVAFVHGGAGSGKSSLVHELQSDINVAQSRSAVGKFDQYRGDIPYSGVTMALRGIVRGILTEGQAEVDGWRRALLDVLGPNVGLMVDVLPELRVVVGEQPPVADVPALEAQNRFNLVFRSFLGTLVSDGRPLVLVLDDLQWADSASLRLLELVATDPTLDRVVVMGAYRDDEVGPAHPLVHTMREIERAGRNVSTIAVPPLELVHVSHFVADALRASPEDVEPLARLCFAKTAGNPLFLARFLEALHEEGLIAFDRQRGSWAWDLSRIERRGVTDNVVELIATRIQKLPEAARATLTIAACLGSAFDLTTLSIVRDRAHDDVATELLPALEADIVIRSCASASTATDEGAETVSYRFSHDRVQQAAYSLMSPADRESEHLAIGRRLLARDNVGRLFEITNHLNLGRRLIAEASERDAVARMNLDAGRAAMASAAYGPALEHLRVALELLGGDGWDRARSLRLDVTTAAAAAASVDGDHDAMEVLVEEVLERARTTLEKVPAYEARINAYVVRWKQREALACAAEVLSLLGVELPVEASQAAAALAIARTKVLLIAKPVDTLARLPAMRDPHALAAMRILAGIATAAYNVAPTLYPRVILEQLRLSAKHGTAPESAFAYAAAGLLFCGLVGDIATGTQLGRLAVRVSQAPEAKRVQPRTEYVFHAFIEHWTAPLRSVVEPCHDVHRRALDVGDVDFACLCTVPLVEYFFYYGAPLEEVERAAITYTSAVRRLGNERNAILLDITTKAVHALTGRTGGLSLLTASADADAKLIEELSAMKDGYSQGAFHTHKLMLAYWAGEYRAARVHADAASALLDQMMASATVPLVVAYAALTDLAVLDGADRWQRARTLLRVRRAQRKLAGWARHSPGNCAHWVALIEAERARVSGDSARAWERYRSALSLAKTHGLQHCEALVDELMGRHCLALGEARIAEVYLRDAHHAYIRWGASLKATALESRYPAVFRQRRRDARGVGALEEISAGTTSSSNAAAIDFLAVTKASQAISSEIVLGPLLERLLQVLLETAGAQRGFLRIDGAPPIWSQHGDAAPTGVAATVVRYVERTGERVVLRDAAAEGSFRSDPHVVEHGVRSVLCMPVRRGERALGILYLENNLASDAFTKERCTVLEILSAQAAISIENARLYDTLEHRVSERTLELSQALEELRRAQQRLIVHEKLASLGRITSGIAHEIRNPLNFVNNFARLSHRSATQTALEITRQRDRLLPGTAEAIEEALRDLSENAARIREHGDRAERVVRAMLEHSREGSREMREVDWNVLVREYVTITHKGQKPATDLEVELHWSLDEGAGRAVVVPEEIGRVLLNLTGNAIHAAAAKKKSAPNGDAPRVIVSTKSLGDRVEVRVHDNGAGIPVALHGKMFEPFFTTKPPGEGTGLGLSISHEIVVRGHGGEIGFETREGAFTEFCVTLPRRPSGAPDRP